MTAETSGATTSLVVDYVRRQGGEAAVAEVVRRSGVPHTAAELADVSRWVSYETRIRLFEATTEVLGDPEATRRIGETALHAGLHHALVLVLRALGSPRQVYRSLPRAVPKFTTTSTMEVLESGRTSATLRYRLHEGYRHSRLDCAYAQGLITVVPELFGLPRATLVHDECESDGAPACVYRLAWEGRRRLPGPGRRSGDRAELAALRGQLAELQSAATDLVASEDVTAVLQRITERAATSVLAPAYLLAVHDPDGGPPLVQSRGLAPERAAELAAGLLAGDDLGPGAVVVDVTSSRRSHGRLAALHADGQRGPADESRLLAAYAGHAAAALDLLVALERSRRGEARAAALLGLARALRASTDAETVGGVVAAALPRIVGSERASVLLWEPASGCLRPVAVEGLPEPRRSAYLSAVLRVDEIPELVTMLTRREPTRLTLATATPALAALMAAIGVEDFVSAPLVAGGRLLGVTTTGWSGPPPDLDAVLEQLQAVAEYAATALENARLLETVRHQAHHDALTGLPNRLLFSRELDTALVAAGDGRGVALLFCDLDRFKHVNDLLGHAAGDELLRQVAGRLRGVLRTGDVVARISGDEFALLLPGVSDPDAAEALAHRVVACFQRPFRVEGRELRCTTSVGVALQPGAGGDGDALLRAADDAMYDAKQRGRNQVSRAARVRDAGAGQRETLAAELRGAVTGGQLRQVFQPVVLAPPASPGSGALRVVGAEGLVRWQHPRLGLLAPAAFLPLAEELGLVADLDLWGVTAACAAAATWPDGPVGPLEVAVNLAASTLLDDRFLDTVRDALAGSGLAPGRLHLEVVESRALVDLPGVVDRLAEVRQLGARVALDDFGTGYSTLSWLQRLPVDRVKVDRSFTAGVPGDAASLSVVRGVLALARELGVEVVAEGVETPEQLAALREAGCRLVQGYLLGPPSPGAPRLLEPAPGGPAGSA